MKSNENSLKRKLLDANKSTLSISTLHGMRKIIKNPFMPIKVMWTVCMFTSIGYCCYGVVTSFALYFEYNVETRLEVKSGIQLGFPVVKFYQYASMR